MLQQQLLPLVFLTTLSNPSDVCLAIPNVATFRISLDTLAHAVMGFKGLDLLWGARHTNVILFSYPLRWLGNIFGGGTIGWVGIPEIFSLEMVISISSPEIWDILRRRSQSAVTR